MTTEASVPTLIARARIEACAARLRETVDGIVKVSVERGSATGWDVVVVHAKAGTFETVSRALDDARAELVESDPTVFDETYLDVWFDQ